MKVLVTSWWLVTNWWLVTSYDKQSKMACNPSGLVTVTFLVTIKQFLI
jgi:hypothetical protein